ncbi:MAG: type 2 isopentenyl-diphosphate Delta-isomerase [Tissierellia bacterium]|nr:type 2 isopentenyl-diphosphate Delta-isomerase [Tissierellia bacterium]
MRQFRKQEHIENFLKSSFRGNTLLDQIFIDHQSLPGVSLDDVDLKTEFLGKTASAPILINAITGGSDFSKTINNALANIAHEFNIPMAVGSQTIALETPSTIESFSIVRRNNPNGIILSNLNGNSTIDDVKKAVEMIGADGIQIHLNVPQELSMAEGDKDFRYIAENISKIVEASTVPVMVKEVGFGMSTKAIKELYDIGIRIVDISGYGGTNFMEIENMRNPHLDTKQLYRWGIPTALSLLEASQLELPDLKLIASGGVASGLDIFHSLVLGASMAGICGELLRYVIHGGPEQARNYINNLVEQLKRLMVLVGSTNVEQLHSVPFRITGTLKDLYTAPRFRQ